MFFAAILVAVLLASAAGQVTQRGKYWSTLYGKDLLSAKALHSLQLNKYQLAELKDDENIGPPKFAHAIDFAIDSKVDGEWLDKGKEAK
jgi:hypothetical protein